jgi:uncharacterized low-complexity protein
MSNKTHMKPVAAAIGAALAGSLAIGAANAADNPFGLSELGSGYMQLAGTEGKCGCLLYTSPSPRDRQKSRMRSSA